MKHLNIARLFIAGIVSGVVIYVFESVTNAVILGHDWKLWGAVADRVFVMPAPGLSLAYWGVQSLVAGVVGAFVYAGLRTWIGNSLRAGWVSGVLIWAVGWLGLSFDKLAMGIEPHKMVYYNLLAALLGCLVGQVLVSLIYKDMITSKDKAK